MFCQLREINFNNKDKKFVILFYLLNIANETKKFTNIIIDLYKLTNKFNLKFVNKIYRNKKKIIIIKITIKYIRLRILFENMFFLTFMKTC